MYHSLRIWSLLLILAMIGCKKKDTVEEEVPPPPVPGCRLMSEYIGQTGNEAYWDFTYDTEGKVTKVEYRGGTGGVTRSVAVGNQSLVTTFIPSNNTNTIFYNTGSFWQSVPQTGHWETKEGATSRVTYYFSFLYGSNDRLVKVIETTDFAGDAEYNLEIAYNDQGNVTRLQYVWTTGPNEIPPAIIVDSHDDHPTPFANIKPWRFFNLYWGWDSADPQPLVTALSRNNPTKIHREATGNSRFVSTYQYTYNPAGFPLTMTESTSVNGGTPFGSTDTYTYECP